MNDASINPDLSQTGPLSAIWYIGSIFQTVGNAAISNLAPLFAIGLGFLEWPRTFAGKLLWLHSLDEL
ncbi:hypothetical protein [Spiroplasma endosymbiont of Glossina fuscipes fuscipes]